MTGADKGAVCKTVIIMAGLAGLHLHARAAGELDAGWLSSGDYCGGDLLRLGTLTRTGRCGRVVSVDHRGRKEHPWL